MLHYGNALDLWIESKGYKFLSDFIKETVSPDTNSSEYKSSYRKVRNLLQNKIFSSNDWLLLKSLDVALTKEELEKTANPGPVQQTPKIENAPLSSQESEKRLRLTIAENRELKRLISNVHQKLDLIIEKLDHPENQ